MADSAIASYLPPTPEPPSDDDHFTLATVDRRVPFLALGLVVLVVLTTWIFGHLPWVLDGFRSPSDTRDVDGTGNLRLVVPLLAGQLTALVAFTTVGSVGATLLPLAFPEIPRGVAVVTAAFALAGTTVVLVLTARAQVAAHATDGFAGDDRVLDGLVVGVLAVSACAAFLGCLASFQVGFLPLPVALLVGQLPLWIGELSTRASLTESAYRVSAVVLLTAAFVISVRRTPWWVVVWPLALLLLWTAHPLWFATWRMQDRLHAGSGLTSANLSDVFSEGREAFAMMFRQHQENWWVGPLSAAVALVWLLVRRRRVAAVA